MKKKIINLGIGFVTGRLLFQNTLKTYINSWIEQGLFENQNIKIHLFIAYDLKYKNTNTNDYKNIPEELANIIENIHFFGVNEIINELDYLEKQDILSKKETDLVFGKGYGKKRNLVIYFAIKYKMNKILFIDDDEYPVATFKNKQNNLLWMGQNVVGTHLKFNNDADITHGHHCGYVSPIPYIKFNNILQEEDFKLFIEAISNDILNWDKIRHLIVEEKGVTYAHSEIVDELQTYEVEEHNGMKFISGANLCFNLKNYKKFPPFYNPPNARGEDTFMSTALSKLKVLKVPCYTFHDSFSMYNSLLIGVLPLTLKPIEDTSPLILKRFISATIGWIRYKPLLVYITNQENYHEVMNEISSKLYKSIPKLCDYFNTKDFEEIYKEFEYYRRNAPKHFKDFEDCKKAWTKLMNNMDT